MKQIIKIAAGICAVLVLLTACRNNEDVQSLDLTGGMYCQVTVTVEEQTIQAELARTTSGICRLTVQEPEELSGLTFDWQQGKLTLSYRGLHWELDSDALPDTAFASALNHCLDAAAQKNGLEIKEEKDGIVTAEGMTESGAFTLCYDSKTGRIQSLSLDSLHLEAQFFNYQEPNS